MQLSSVGRSGCHKSAKFEVLGMVIQKLPLFSQGRKSCAENPNNTQMVVFQIFLSVINTG